MRRNLITFVKRLQRIWTNSCQFSIKFNTLRCFFPCTKKVSVFVAAFLYFFGERRKRIKKLNLETCCIRKNCVNFVKHWLKHIVKYYIDIYIYYYIIIYIIIYIILHIITICSVILIHYTQRYYFLCEKTYFSLWQCQCRPLFAYKA